MEQENFRWPEIRQARNGNGRRIMSPEIVEIGDESKSLSNSRDGGAGDVYVAVGKDDLDVLKWALDHVVHRGNRVFLVHVFPPVNTIATPGGSTAVGKLSRNQVSQEQVNTYIREEETRRRNILQKYIRLCTDAKVAVDTMLIKSDLIAKAILELIPVLDINTLVMGTKRPVSRWLRKGLGIGESVQKSAPDSCEVILVFDGKKVTEGQHVGRQHHLPMPNGQRARLTPHAERTFFDCACFSGKFN